ncbi:MAG: glycoside hydrolase family 16 protein [Bacteroidales bacterium]|nr:glycoside hydrolase family 16 protein [Bacteroidales bacterium]
MKKLRILLISTFIFLFNNNYAQLVPYVPSEWDTVWTYTVFEDLFDGTSLDPSKWDVVTNYGRGACIFVNLPGTTYSVSNGSLRLNMLNNPGNNYCFTQYPEGIIKCPDFISAEVSTKNPYKYGVYEGRMKFAYNTGSWPAFWMHGGSEPDAPEYDDFGTEIDFAEYNWSYGGNDANTDHVFHYWLDEPGEQMSISNGLYHTGITWSTWHTFKIVYRPYDVTFYIDGNFSWRRSRFYCIWNTGDGTILSDIFIEDIYEQPHPIYYEWDWFPKHGGIITLSQQVPDYNHIDGAVVVPQTSYFDYVTFKKFFAKPEITCPNIICSTTNATLDVDDAATNITWTLSPGYPFSGNLSGTGKTATIIPSSTEHGKGKITWTFDMPSGESFSVEKEIRVNGPGYEDVYLDIRKATGESVPKVGGHYLLCPNTHYHITLMNDFGACALSDYDWSTLPSAWSVNYYYNVSST